MLTLPRQVWEQRQAAHRARVDHWINPHLARTSRGEKHPIHDFLFEYYPHRPSHLRRWHPGLGVALADAPEFADLPFYRTTPTGLTTADPSQLKPNRREAVAWIAHLLRSVDARPPFFGCAGLHEWAMVHRADEIRHATHPLRLAPAVIAAVVESHPIRCTHFDAFRFFTPAARPLNRVQPARETVPDLEQSGCLHANMDLYKWAFKLSPFTPSELVADTFALARDIREIDMRASPYDFTSLGFDPIPIETPGGRATYESHQRDFTQRAVPYRRSLIGLCERILTHLGPDFSTTKNTKIMKNA
jgi:hypothetical protein